MVLLANPKEQYLSYKNEIQEAIDRVLESGRYILGEEVKFFETEFASFVGTKYSVSVASGTDALFLSLKVLNIGQGDEVITVSHTATATISAIEATGAKAVFVDIEEDYYTIDPSKINLAITPNTKAVIAVHMYGQPCDMDRISEIADKNDLYIIEDCAQANGAKYKNKDVGSMGVLGCFSFFPTKNLGAIGDGGAITTNSKELYEKLLMLRQYGWNDQRESKFQGYNSRLDELQAAILRVKLSHLRNHIEQRNKLSQLYCEKLENLDIVLPKIRENCYHAFHLFVIRIDNREKLQEFLLKHEISAMIHYELPVHQHTAYKRDIELPITENIVRSILSLPFYPELSKKMVNKILTHITNFRRV